MDASPDATASSTGKAVPAAAYAELHVLSNFSFLRGASHAGELIERAVALGYQALAITDECSMAGVVRAHVRARETGLSLIVGSEFTLACGMKLVALAATRQGYAQICRLITCGRRAARKGSYRLTRQDLVECIAAPTAQPDCLLIWLPGERVLGATYCGLEGHANPLVVAPLYVRRAVELGARVEYSRRYGVVNAEEVGLSRVRRHCNVHIAGRTGEHHPVPDGDRPSELRPVRGIGPEILRGPLVLGTIPREKGHDASAYKGNGRPRCTDDQPVSVKGERLPEEILVVGPARKVKQTHLLDVDPLAAFESVRVHRARICVLCDVLVRRSDHEQVPAQCDGSTETRLRSRRSARRIGQSLHLLPLVAGALIYIDGPLVVVFPMRSDGGPFSIHGD